MPIDLIYSFLFQIQNNEKAGPGMMTRKFMCEKCLPVWQLKMFQENQRALAKKEAYFVQLIEEINGLLSLEP